MPFRLWLTALLLLLVSVRSADSEEKVIKGDFDLNALSAYLPTATATELTARIDNYTNPGQLKIDLASGLVKTLTLQRFSSDSDAVIDFDGTLIDIKGFTGTLILKGLAFRLKPRATLISGFDAIKPNKSLILDSCFLYADSFDGTMLAWQGDAESNIEIKNSWFVAKSSSTNEAKILLAGGRFSLTNNLFNFPGTINAAPVLKEFAARYNTFNRVQIILNGTASLSGYPTYAFTQNMAAFHGPLNVVGGNAYYLLGVTNFNTSSSVIQNNRIYKDQWAGIGYPPSVITINTDSILSGVDGKTPGELWNWYTDSLVDAKAGMLAGNTLNKRYNVLPPAKSFTTWKGTDSLQVSFKSADFPRMFTLNQSEYPERLDSAFRMRAPFAGKLSFGPFQVENIRVNGQPPGQSPFGKPILFAQTEPNVFKPQAHALSSDQSASFYFNNTLASRIFLLADSGNTPRGNGIEPSNHGGESFDHVRFGRVTASGQTIIQSETNTSVPAGFRFLGRTFVFKTTASVHDTLTFATAPGADSTIWSKPQDNAIFWYWTVDGKGTGIIPAIRSSIWDASLFQGEVPFSDSVRSFFRAFLMEKLSLPPGKPFVKKLEGATLHSYSTTGYQIYPETSQVDTLLFGSPTQGYTLRWVGRVEKDSLFLILPKPASPDAQVFVQVPGKAEAEPLLSVPFDSAGFRIPIGREDSGKIFFAGVKYNIIANQPPFYGIIDGVRIGGLLSTVSGRLSFRELPAAEAQRSGNGRDTVFLNTRYLAGKTIDASRLASVDPFTLTFALPAGAKADSGLEAWYMNNGTWEKFPGFNPVIGDSLSVTLPSLNVTHIVAVKRFQAPETYATTTLIPGKRDSLIFHLGGEALTASPIQSYCLEVRAIGPSGELRNLGCEEKSPGDTVKKQLATDSGWAYSYRVVYFLGNDKYKVVREFQYPPQFAWDSRKALDTSSRRTIPQGVWRLVSAPADTTRFLRALLQPMPRDTTGDGKDTFLKLTLAVGISNVDGVARFDTLTDIKKEAENKKGLDTVQLRRHRALLVASSHPNTLTLDAAGGGAMKTPKPETLAVAQGWNFIGNPYPINLRKECLQSSKGFKIRPRELLLISGEYKWDFSSPVLPPFTGFAYFSPEPDWLIYDPSTPIPVPAAKKASGPDSWIPVTLDSEFGKADMALVKGKGEYPIGNLPAPQARLELRVGGGQGYWIKPVADPGRIDEPVEVLSAQAGNVRFSVGAAGAGPDFILIEEATGHVYDRAAARTLPVRAGAQSYRLVAGDADFIAKRSQSFQSTIPASLGLSQNFPNPARGLTRIFLDWPASRDRERKAHLEILDTRGRRVAYRPLDGMRVGRQAIDLDASGWKPGVYVYRVAVHDGGKVSRYQRKMLVAP